MPRVGPKMLEAQRYIRQHPGCTKHEVSVRVGPNGSNTYGYAIVMRALAAGLIENRGTPSHSALYVKEGD